MTISEFIAGIAVVVAVFQIVIMLQLKNLRQAQVDLWTAIDELRTEINSHKKDTEHRVTELKIRQDNNIERIEEIWRKCFGAFRKPMDCNSK